MGVNAVKHANGNQREQLTPDNNGLTSGEARQAVRTLAKSQLPLEFRKRSGFEPHLPRVTKIILTSGGLGTRTSATQMHFLTNDKCFFIRILDESS